MELKVINSNSAGNAYILETADEALLIECGVRFDAIKKAINFQIRKIKGCILTHEHGDHAKAAREVVAAGITLYASKGTLSATDLLIHHRSEVITVGHEFSVGNFRIKAFDIQHDAAEPMGFLIMHPECGKVLFLTDSFYCKYAFSGLNNIIVEANYSKKIIDDRLKAGANPKMLRDRILQSHMSIDTCLNLLCANDLSNVQNIVLIHLSDSNSHEEEFKRIVIAGTGKSSVHVAKAGLSIPFNTTPF